MGFLDNSGDIILDAVLTDHGRKVMAKGDGSFQITKFALGDDEINYKLYDYNHASGSSYYDLQIIQTPVLESFTNNTSTMKSMLFTFEDNNLEYLPVMKINTNVAANKQHASGLHLIAVDAYTEGTDNNNGATGPTSNRVGREINSTSQEPGVLFTTTKGDYQIRVDQGIDNESFISNPSFDHVEEIYTIQVDGNLCSVVNSLGDALSTTNVGPTFNTTADDDNMVNYVVAKSNDATGIVSKLFDDEGPQVAGLNGLGTKMIFKLQPTNILAQNNAYFLKYGFKTTVTPSYGGGALNVYAIDSIVRITGNRFGYSIDVPVRFVKQIP